MPYETKEYITIKNYISIAFCEIKKFVLIFFLFYLLVTHVRQHDSSYGSPEDNPMLYRDPDLSQ